MSFYLDPSVIVSLFIADSMSLRAERALRSAGSEVIVSDFGSAEFASALARRVRAAELTAGDARSIFADFDEWTARHVTSVNVGSADIAMAGRFLRGLDTPLRTPDALHVAVTQRIGATLLTFDKKLASAARALGVTVAKT